jgi:hypothetical protein
MAHASSAGRHADFVTALGIGMPLRWPGGGAAVGAPGAARSMFTGAPDIAGFDAGAGSLSGGFTHRRGRAIAGSVSIDTSETTPATAAEIVRGNHGVTTTLSPSPRSLST